VGGTAQELHLDGQVFVDDICLAATLTASVSASTLPAQEGSNPALECFPGRVRQNGP
jgi:hypothetical protein